MNIAVYVPSGARFRFIVETFFPLFEQFPSQKLFLITDEQDVLKNYESMIIKAAPKNPFLKKFWIERALMGCLKKIKADLFISADNFCSLNTSLPQGLLLPDLEKIKPVYVKKAQLIVVMSEINKKQLIHKWSIDEKKIIVVAPWPGKTYGSIDAEKKESIKNKYSEGKEYFLFDSSLRKQEDIIELLKSFSHFKKRQQSSFKIVIMAGPNPDLEKNISNYKYRDDVVLIRSNDTKEKATLMASAYAFISYSAIDEDIPAILNAMRSGVPIIVKGLSVNEIAGDSVLYANNNIKDIGDKMMQLYKDENLRSELIKKGNEAVKNYTEEKSAAQLWRSVTEAMN